MITAVVFDLDGTLVDTREANYLAYKQAFARHGLELQEKDFDRHYGTAWLAWGPQFAGDKSDAVHAFKQKMYESFLSHAVPIEKHIVLLEAFQNTHVTALLTSASRVCAGALLRKFKLCFQVEFYVEEYLNREKALKALFKQLRLSPSEVLVIDDRPENIVMAHRLGCRIHQATI